MTDSAVLFGVGMNGAQAGQALDGEALAACLREDQLGWAHLNANAHAATTQWLHEHVPYLDSLILSALLAEETRPRFEEMEQGALVILRGVNLNDGAEPEDMISLRLWIDAHRIISLQRRPLKAVQDIRRQILEQKDTAPHDAGSFISQLILQLIERMAPTLALLEDRMDALEEDMLNEANLALRAQIVDVRREALTLRRYLAPQRDAIARMRASELPWLSAKDKRHLQEAYDRMTRFVENLDMIRERSQIAQDELATILTDRMNKNMYVLSVIAAIFLPLGFLTGLFGINVGGMPGVESGDGFWLVCAGLTIITALQVVIFKWLRWF